MLTAGWDAAEKYPFGQERCEVRQGRTRWPPEEDRILQALGLGPAEEVIYTTLLACPAASAQELARRSGLDEAETDASCST
ncbi:hypothetical protein AB0E67_11025 [Streptomyces sp. NPDC032161]|uniref:hypothetical protein n=1 Tax=unclassified Streptomyces TaxID=2593676 RepID=UPI0033FBEFF2